jgi:hypothetical protein
MGSWFKGLVVGVGLSVVALVVLRSGLIDIHWPWEDLPDLASVESEVAAPEGARIASVEPITLDCRSRVHAVVPVEGVRRHRLLGQVYRTDRMSMDAIGDVDTCVEGASVQVTKHPDGRTEVVVPAQSIRFERPRVDAVATAGSVDVDKGEFGKLTDIFPWVDESSGLVPQGYAYAQYVIGGSACMQAAYEQTSSMLVEGYRQQFVDQGLDPDQLTVRVEGLPQFAQNDAVDFDDDLEFSTAPQAVTCEPAGEGSGVQPPAR